MTSAKSAPSETSCSRPQGPRSGPCRPPCTRRARHRQRAQPCPLRRLNAARPLPGRTRPSTRSVSPSTAAASPATTGGCGPAPVDAGPCEGALDHPALGLNDEAGVGALDDLDWTRSRRGDAWSLVASVGEDAFEEGEARGDRSRTNAAPSRSCTLAEWTSTCRVMVTSVLHIAAVLGSPAPRLSCCSRGKAWPPEPFVGARPQVDGEACFPNPAGPARRSGCPASRRPWPGGSRCRRPRSTGRTPRRRRSNRVVSPPTAAGAAASPPGTAGTTSTRCPSRAR